MDWDTDSEHGRRRAWQAICHEVIGVAATLERDLDHALALAHGRSNDAVERLHTEVFPRVGIDVKCQLLESVLRSTVDPMKGWPAEVSLPFCVPGLRRVFYVRNAIAHSEVSSRSTNQTVILESWRRGKSAERRISLSSIDYVRKRLAEALEKDLDSIGGWAAADPSLLDEARELDS